MLRAYDELSKYVGGYHSSNHEKHATRFSRKALAATQKLLSVALENGLKGLIPEATLAVDDAGLRYDVMECANTHLRKYRFVARVGLKYPNGSPQGTLYLKVVGR